VPSPSSIEDALYAILHDDTDVEALVGDRIYPVEAPKGATLPYIVYSMITEPQDLDLSGAAGLAWPRMQLDCYGRPYKTAKDVAQRAVLALHGFTGTAAGVLIQFTQTTKGPDGFSEAPNSFRKIVEVQFILEGPLS